MFKKQLVLFALFLWMPGMGQSENSHPLPSEILSQTKQQIRHMITEQTLPAAQAYKHANSLIKARVEKVQPESLNREELFLYTTLLQRTDQQEQAKPYLHRLMKGLDLPAQKAWSAFLELLCKEKKFTEAEKQLDIYKKRFQPNPAFAEDISQVIIYLMAFYQKQGATKKAIALYLDEFQRLPPNAPYSAFNHVDFHWKLFEEAGQKHRLLAEAKKKLGQLKATYRDRKTHSETDRKPLKRLIAAMDRTFHQFELIGKPGPALAFSDFLNAPSFTLADFKGKVVVLDFWATWCGGCLYGFPKLVELNEHFKGDPFQILGITSIYETPKENLGTFLKKHNITWPNAISTESVHTLEAFGINGLPTYVVLDKTGTVRFLELGTTANLRQIIIDLLAE